MFYLIANHKKKPLKKKKLVCFVLIKGWTKYAKQMKTSKLNFVKRRVLQFVLFLKIGRAFDRWSDFRSDKKYFATFEKYKVVSSTFRLK